MRTGTTNRIGNLINQIFGKEPRIEIVPKDQDYTIAKIVSTTLDVKLSNIVGVYDTEEKMICIAFEIFMDRLVEEKYLSRKYNIYPRYMKYRLIEFRRRLLIDPLLQLKMDAVQQKLESINQITT